MISRHVLPSGGGAGTLPVTDGDTSLYRGGVDLLKTDDSLHVAGSTRTFLGFQNGNFQFERTFSVSFDGVADRKADIYLSAASTAVIGVFDVTISSSWSTGDATGQIRASYSFAGTSVGAVQQNVMTVLAAQGPITTNYALMPITWDAVNLRWRITIGKTVAGTAGVVSVSVRYLANLASRLTSVRDGMAVSAVYTDVAAVTANTRTPILGLANGDILLWGTDTNLKRDVADTLKTDDAFIAAGGLVAGANSYEQSFEVAFGTAANEKADIYFGGAVGSLAGSFEVTVTSYWAGANAHGTIKAIYSTAVSATAVTGTLHLDVVSVSGPLSTQFAVAPAVTWDATNSRAKITIAHLTATANKIGVTVKFVAADAGYVARFRSSLGVSAVYTTDATVFAQNVKGPGSLALATTDTVLWGTDTNLYRSAADTLKTDDSLHVGATLRHLGASLGFYNTAPTAKPTVTGSRTDGTALTSLLTALATLGLITDSSTA